MDAQIIVRIEVFMWLTTNTRDNILSNLNFWQTIIVSAKRSIFKVIIFHHWNWIIWTNKWLEYYLIWRVYCKLYISCYVYHEDFITSSISYDLGKDLIPWVFFMIWYGIKMSTSRLIISGTSSFLADIYCTYIFVMNISSDGSFQWPFQP